MDYTNKAMNFRCVICGETVIPHRYYRKEHKTCGSSNCMKTYRKQHASLLDIQRRAVQRAVNQANGLEMIACAVCGEKFEVIQHTHLKRHGLTVTQYRKQYPSARLMTDKMREGRGRGAVAQLAI